MSKILRGLRGATTAAANTREAILEATAELLRALQEANGFQPDEVESAIFTSSPDLTAEYPARAAHYAPARRGQAAAGPARAVTTAPASRSVVVSAKGAARWQGGHPWIYRTDLYDEPRDAPGIVAVTDRRGRHLGQALYSPKSEIRLRLLTRGREPIDAGWWSERIAAAEARRAGIPATAYRVVHAEGDGLPSLVVDRYGPYVVAQLLSAGLEQAREDVVAGIRRALAPEGILLRNDAPIRRHEALPLEVVPAFGGVPDTLAVEEHGIRYLAAPHTGQKTGAFLDQRENRVLVAEQSGAGRALDLFTYHGSFALHLARRAREVIAVDSSADALTRGRENAALNGLANIAWREANAFDLLRELERRDDRFDTIVLDPPAFAKDRKSTRLNSSHGYISYAVFCLKKKKKT